MFITLTCMSAATKTTEKYLTDVFIHSSYNLIHVGCGGRQGAVIVAEAAGALTPTAIGVTSGAAKVPVTTHAVRPTVEEKASLRLRRQLSEITSLRRQG